MKNPMDLTGCRYLITGASSGIGRETAVVLDELGATLVLVGRRREELKKTAASLRKTARIEIFNLAQMSDIPTWLKQVATEAGPLDGIVHCAGIQSTTPLRILTEQQLQDTLDINLKSAVGLAKGYRQKGVCRTPGSIVFISSVASRIGQPGQIAYAASKAGLEAACRCMAMELAREDIRVNAVLPGLVRTEMAERWFKIVTTEQAARMEAAYPLGIGTARDIAYAVAFLLGRETGRWITGTAFVVDGGCSAGTL
jgi:NAD(P)-dependent dehydrogenase (short-subunit alcohol dehydrogenase family)